MRRTPRGCDTVPYDRYTNCLHREGSEAEDAGVNDSPVDCQSRVLTEPQREMPLPYDSCDETER